MSSSYPLPLFFSSPSSSPSSSSTTTPFQRGPYQMNYHHAPPPPMYYPFPPPFDGSVNLNNPYIYDPTHVKHRRRTTPEQLKVLEETFKTDPKPNPALRKQLSLELGMTPRVLQVWFQNRRMKVKRLVKKQGPSSTHQPLAETFTNDSACEQQQSENPSSSSPTSNTAAIATGSVASTAPASASTPTPTPPSGSSSPSPAPSPSSQLCYPDLTLRRSSLPLTVGFNSGSNHRPSFHQQQQHQPPHIYQHHGLPWNNDGDDNSTSRNAMHMSNFPAGGNDPSFDPLTDPLLLRRRSFASLHRLESHPFAPLVAASNGLTNSLLTRHNQSLAPEASSISSATYLNTNASVSTSGTSSADNTSNVSAPVPFPPNATSSLPEATVTTVSEAAENVFATFSKSKDSNNQDIACSHSQESRERVSNVGSTEDNLDGSRLRTETIPGSTRPEENQGQRDSQGPFPISVNARGQGPSEAETLQQQPLFLQRSQSTSQARSIFTHQHSSSTPPYIFTHEAAQGPGFDSARISDGIPSHTTHLTHSHTNTPMGVIQPGFRSASFHGIIPDNYHAYYNRQMLAGQGILAGRCGDAGIHKRLSTGHEHHPLGRRLHPTPSTLHQQQPLGVIIRDHMHMTSRSVSSTTLLDHSNRHHNAEIAAQSPQPSQHSQHFSLPTPQYRQLEVSLPTAHPPYAFPPRPVGDLLPGPLPAADYSFGTATSSDTGTDSEMLEKQDGMQNERPPHHSWDSAGTSNVGALNNTHNKVEFASNTDTYEDIERGYETRFGSITSLASVPSMPGASEGGATAEWDWDWEIQGLKSTADGRRGSCTGQVAELFSNLEVGSRRGSEESIYSSQSAYSLNTPDGIPHSEGYSRDPDETRELSYPVPDVILRSCSNGDKVETVVATVECRNGFSDKKEEENGHGVNEDQRKTPSAESPEIGRNSSSDASKKPFYQSQSMNVSGKDTHADQTTSAYSQIHPESIYCTPLPDFYGREIGAEYGTSQLGVARDVSDHGMGMNIDMGVEVGERCHGVDLGYGSQGQDRFRMNTEDNMLGVERYTGIANTITGGSYDEIY